MVFTQKPAKFDVSAQLEEIVNAPLAITGAIPDWLSGTLVRNGPITVTINGKSNEHWFDGLAMLHAFSFHEGKIRYTNKFLRSDAYETVFKKGSLHYDGFASDPCRSLFKRFLTFFVPGHPAPNANVNVARLADAYVALTETPLPIRFDPHTLDTLGVLDYQDKLPKGQCWESAHPHYNQNEKKTFNYLINFGRISTYTLYTMGESPQRTIIAEIPVEEPSYMHSFATTENHVIFTEFPLVVKPLDLITKGIPFIKNFTWQPERGTQFIVVNRHTGQLVGKYRTKPFFAFHHANAFEKEGAIHMDIVTYEDARVITGIHLASDQTMVDDSPTRLEIFSLSLKTGAITSDILFSKDNEFPRINEKLDGLPYRFVYSAGIGENALYKVNTATKEVLTWTEEGCSPGEPLFVAAPDAQDEDEGVVLAIMIDRIRQGSFLLIMDGKSFKEISRAEAPHLIPAGLHGQYFN